MTKIREMLGARRREIAAEMDKAVAHLKQELREIDAAIMAMDHAAHGSLILYPPTVIASPAKKAKPPSVGELALRILADHPAGLRTADIRDIMAKQFGRELTMKNMSWYLSRLKREGAITQEGDRWMLHGGPKDETPPVATGGVSR